MEFSIQYRIQQSGIRYLDCDQTSANWGPNLRFVLEVIIKALISKSSSSLVIKLLDRTRVTQPQGESWVKSTLIIGHFRVIRQVITFVLCRVGEFLMNSVCWSSYSPKLDCDCIFLFFQLCKKNLEGKGFFVKAGKPFCKSHARLGVWKFEKKNSKIFGTEK